jgi:hypothetical protein
MAVQTNSSDLAILATWMAGEFSNWEQAIANPPLFAHIRVCIRPLPTLVVDRLIGEDRGLWLYSEQAYDFEIHRPYRTAVLQLLHKGDRIEFVNYKLVDPPAYFGASRNPAKLDALQHQDLERQDGCNMLLYRTEHNTFKGAVEPGKKCCVVRKNQSTYLDSEFEIGENTLISRERGRDPETDEHVWGSIAGAFQFQKKTCFPLEGM